MLALIQSHMVLTAHDLHPTFIQLLLQGCVCTMNWCWLFLTNRCRHINARCASTVICKQGYTEEQIKNYIHPKAPFDLQSVNNTELIKALPYSCTSWGIRVFSFRSVVYLVHHPDSLSNQTATLEVQQQNIETGACPEVASWQWDSEAAYPLNGEIDL